MRKCDFLYHMQRTSNGTVFFSLSLFKFICLILCCGMLNCHVLSYWCISLKNIRWKASSTLRCIVFVQMHAYAELQQTLSWSNEWQQKMGIVSPSIDSHLKVMVKSKMVLNETRFFEKCLVMRNLFTVMWSFVLIGAFKCLAHVYALNAATNKWINLIWLYVCACEWVNERATASTRAFLPPSLLLLQFLFIIYTSEYRVHSVCVRFVLFCFCFDQYFIFICVSDMLDWPVSLTDTSSVLSFHFGTHFFSCSLIVCLCVPCTLTLSISLSVQAIVVVFVSIG